MSHSLEVVPTTRRITVEDGKLLNCMENFHNISVFFGDSEVAMEFFVVKELPFDAIIGLPKMGILGRAN